MSLEIIISPRTVSGKSKSFKQERFLLKTEVLSDGYHDIIAVALGWSATQDDDTMEVYEFNLEDFKTDPIFAN